MPVDNCQLNVGRTSDGYVVAVHGRGTVQSSRAFQEFASSCFQCEVPSVTVDLSSCEYVDSTFLGCLVSLHKKSRQRPGCQFTIAASDEKRESLLAPTQMDRVLKIVDSAPEALGEMQTLGAVSSSEQALGRHIMECHRALAQVEGPCQNAFASVANRLAKELGESS